MRAIVTGQVGMNKRPYLEAVARHAAERGEPMRAFHVGDRMYAEAPDIRPGRILDVPLSRLKALRRAAFKDILNEAAGEPNAIVNTHATFRWRHGLFRAFDFDQMKAFAPDLCICLVDNIDAVHHRLHAEHTLDATLKDLMVWREEEIMATELLAEAVGCGHAFYVVGRGREEVTTETTFRLVCRPGLTKVYPSFPMTHVMDMPDVLEEIRRFRRALADHMIPFDPAEVDEKALLESAMDAARAGEDFITATSRDADGAKQTFAVSVKQVLDIASDIDGQIYARDFKLIDQSDMIVSLVPELPNGAPGLSSGVERELQHAFEGGKEVYVVWKPRKSPSPFITETATRVFRSTDEAIDHFRGTGKLVTT